MADAASFVPAQDTHFMPLMAHLGGVEKTNHLFSPWRYRRFSRVLVLCRPYFRSSAATSYSGTASSRAQWWVGVIKPD